MSTSAEAAIKSAARQKQYENVLLLVKGEDLKAKEAQCHLEAQYPFAAR